MIPRLKIGQAAPAPTAIWPTVGDGDRAPLFLGRAPLRKLVLLVDADLLAPLDTGRWSKLWLLAGLLTHELIEATRYADDGPPANVPRAYDDLRDEHVPGWAIAGEPDEVYGMRPVRWSTADHISDGCVMLEASVIAAADESCGVYGELEPIEAAARRAADALAAQVARAIGADLFMTSRRYPREATWDVAKGVTCCDVDGTVALIGLYLRTQGMFVTSRHPDGRGTFTMNRGLFFWIGARELLPAAWRWFAACVQYSTSGGSDDLLRLGQSVLQRAQRALQVRDEVHVAMNKPQNNDTADEALSSLDVVLLLLMGAVDATARVAHHVLELTIDLYSAGWQRPA